MRLAGAFWSVPGGCLQGRLDSLVLAGAPAGVSLEHGRRTGSATRFQPHQGRRHARLADGRRLAELTIAADRSSLVLSDELPAKLPALNLPGLGASQTFPAWTGMAELLVALGATPRRVAAFALPTPRAERAVAAAAGPVGAFRRRCGQCHDTPEPPPPNFLHGDSAAVAERLAQCAPRIYYRLSMWDLPTARRGKTPMPPLTALTESSGAGGAGGEGGEAWTRSPERAQLLEYARGLLAARGADPVATLVRPFESLPVCVPARTP